MDCFAQSSAHSRARLARNDEAQGDVDRVLTPVIRCQLSKPQHRIGSARWRGEVKRLRALESWFGGE
jgi:hypothetical protein